MAMGGRLQRQRVWMKTDYGLILLDLYVDHAPVTVHNFLRYVRDGFYNQTIFHRVISNFIVQGGGFEPGMIQKLTRAPIKCESNNGLHNERGTIAMARIPAYPDSATSQFFFNTCNSRDLDYSGDGSEQSGYTVFGKVVDGMQTVDRINGVATKRVYEHRHVPTQDILLMRAWL